MPSDNVVLSTNIGTGATMRSLADASSNEWAAAVVCYATTVSAGANVLQVVTAANPLPVTSAITGSVAVTGTFWQTTQPVSGALTANAGTNLNTSALALETGGNLAAIAGKTPALGQALAAASTPVVLTAIQVAALTPLLTVGVTGTVAVTQSGSWSDTVTQATAANLNATVVGTGTFVVQAAQSGTWNVGTVTAVTAITNALPSGTNLLGQAAVADQVASIYNGTTLVSTAVVPISVSASGATTLVAAVAGKRIYVLRWSAVFAGTVSMNFQSHVTTSNATGARPMVANATAGGAWCPGAIFITTIGEALDITLSAAVGAYGELTYVQF